MVLDVFLGLDSASRGHVAQKYGIGPDADLDFVVATLVERLEDVHAARDIPVNHGLVEAVTTHRQVILFITTFFSQLRQDRLKRTKYSDQALHRLLDAVRVPFGKHA